MQTVPPPPVTCPGPVPGQGQGMVVSIVSHGHGVHLQSLLQDLAALQSPWVQRVVLTLNLPEPLPLAPAGGWPFALQVITNDRPAGFGANHNRALDGAHETLACILNPDVRLAAPDPLAALAQTALGDGVGAAYPEQVDNQGRPQDSERQIPSPTALFRRRVLGRHERVVEWVNAACLVIPVQAWKAVGGFDERYFMYCEDVDLCLRLRLQRLALVKAPVQVVHAGQRASHRDGRHLAWHVRSLLRLWTSAPYRQARRLVPAGAAAGVDAA